MTIENDTPDSGEALDMESLASQVLEDIEQEETEVNQEADRDIPVQKGNADQEVAQEDRPEEETPTEIELKEAPSHWNTALKESYAELQKLPEEHRGAVEKMRQGLEETYTGMSQAFNEGMQNISSIKNFQDKFTQQVSGISDQFAKNPAAFMNSMIETVSLLNEAKNDPQGTVTKIAESLGVDINNMEQEYTDPVMQRELAKRDKELESLKQTIAQLNQQNPNAPYGMQMGHMPDVNYQTNNDQNDQVTQKVNEFAEATNSDGTLKYPHFTDPDVQEKMFSYGNEMAQTGRSITPQVAYIRAVRELGKDTQKPTAEEAKATPIEQVKKTPHIPNTGNFSFEDVAMQIYNKAENMG